MKRLLTALAVFGVGALLAHPAARAQDEVRYYDREAKKDATASGAIKEETPGQIVVKPKIGAQKEIPALDVTDVVYQVASLIKFKYTAAHVAELEVARAASPAARKKALQTALTKYQELLPETKEAKAKRHMEYTIARLLAVQSEDDPDQAEKATAALQEFIKNNPDAWQLGHAARTLARLQIARKDYAGALKTYDDLAKTAGIPKELREECDLQSAEVLVSAGKFADAESKLQALAQSVKPDAPEAVKVQVALAQCQAATGKIDQAVPKLEAIIAKISDNDLRALAYNTLGECYFKANKHEEALWPFLKVDVLYHQNKDQHAKALYYLCQLFKERQDDAKAQACKERLEKDKDFAGSEYQRKAADLK